MIAAIVRGIHESAGEVAGLLAVTALVALLAWLGHRQEQRRAAARAVRRIPPPLDAAVLSAPVDPWPDAVDPDELSLRDLVATWAGAR